MKKLLISVLMLVSTSVFADEVIRSVNINNSTIITGDGNRTRIWTNRRSVDVEQSSSAANINGLTVVTRGDDVEIIIPRNFRNVTVKTPDGMWHQVYNVKR